MYAPTLSPLKLLRTNSSETLFEENITNFKTHLLERGHPENYIQATLSEVAFEDRNQALRQKKKDSCLFGNATSPISV